MLLQIVEPSQSSVPTSQQVPVAVGIDLGTTHSLVALSQNHKPFILKDQEGALFEPSLVAYPDTHQILTGKAAKELLMTSPHQVISSIKRLMGRGHDDLRKSSDKQRFSFDPHFQQGLVRLKIGDQSLTPVEISAEILKHLKLRAEEALGHPISQAVITVPAYFDDAGRTATRDAARLAGLDVLRLVNEPTAAALAYGLDKALEGTYAVYDLGGGTFDLSLLHLEKGVFQVIATGGDTQLGGDDFDEAILHHLSGPHLEKLSLEDYKRALETARKMKEMLTTHATVEKNFTRTHFETLIQPLVQRTLDLSAQVLRDADLTPADIQGVVLVGGSTRVPLVVQMVKDFFGQSPLQDINPDEAVALGAALQAEALTQGSTMLLLDVVPLSLGLETMGGIVEKLIYRNTAIPTSKTQEFTTSQNGQTALKFHVVQGERELVKDCRSLAQFELRDLPPLPAGKVRVEVTFTVDADGLLTVTAREKETGLAQHMEVKPTYGLSEPELKQMILSTLKPKESAE